jgi:hypothetical protein
MRQSFHDADLCNPVTLQKWGEGTSGVLLENLRTNVQRKLAQSIPKSRNWASGAIVVWGGAGAVPGAAPETVSAVV